MHIIRISKKWHTQKWISHHSIWQGYSDTYLFSLEVQSILYDIVFRLPFRKLYLRLIRQIYVVLSSRIVYQAMISQRWMRHEFLNKMKNVIQLWFIKEIVGSLDSSVTFPVTVCLKEDYFSANMELWTNLVALRAFVSASRLERAVVKPIVLCVSTCLPPVFHYRLGIGLRKLLSAWSQPWWERGHCRGNGASALKKLTA